MGKCCECQKIRDDTVTVCNPCIDKRDSKIAALTRERDEAVKEVERLKTKLLTEDDRLSGINAQNEKRIAALEKALSDYGEHRAACRIYDINEKPCSCGLDAALAGGKDGAK